MGAELQTPCVNIIETSLRKHGILRLLVHMLSMNITGVPFSDLFKKKILFKSYMMNHDR